MWQPCELLYTCYLLTYLQQSDEQVCVQPPYLGSQHDAARSRSGACSYRSISGSTGARAAAKLLLHSGAGGRCGSKGGCYRRDRQTDGRTLDRYIDSAWHTTRACSVNNCEVCLIQTLDRRLAHVPYSQRSHSFVWSWRPLNYSLYRLPSNLLNVV